MPKTLDEPYLATAEGERKDDIARGQNETLRDPTRAKREGEI